MNKAELENLAAIRIKEADILLTADCYQGAYYLAGYALECTLKACIAKQVKEFDFPDKKLANDSYTHKLADLVITAGLKQKLIEQEKQNEEFKYTGRLLLNGQRSLAINSLLQNKRRMIFSLQLPTTNQEYFYG